MNMFKTNKLCRPAFVYLTISLISLAFIALQNMSSCTKYNIGDYSCDVTSVFGIFIIKIIYVLFWTYVLNLICTDDNKSLAWLLVLTPFLLSFVIIGIFVLL